MRSVDCARGVSIPTGRELMETERFRNVTPASGRKRRIAARHEVAAHRCEADEIV
jgi:hypothetical protein